MIMLLAQNLKWQNKFTKNSQLFLFQSEDLIGLDNSALEELQRLHVEAITKICQAKVMVTLLIFFFN